MSVATLMPLARARVVKGARPRIRMLPRFRHDNCGPRCSTLYVEPCHDPRGEVSFMNPGWGVTGCNVRPHYGALIGTCAGF